MRSLVGRFYTTGSPAALPAFLVAGGIPALSMAAAVGLFFRILSKT